MTLIGRARHRFRICHPKSLTCQYLLPCSYCQQFALSQLLHQQSRLTVIPDMTAVAPICSSEFNIWELLGKARILDRMFTDFAQTVDAANWCSAMKPVHVR
jgi:hypothetical protein